MNQDFVINREELPALLERASKGAKIVSIVACTDPRMKKTGNPYNGRNIRKRAHVVGVINWNYAMSVNRQLCREEKQDDFVPRPRQWGQRMAGTPWVHHTNKAGQFKKYIELKVERSIAHEFVDMDTNERVDKDVCHSFITQRSDSGRQGVDKPIILRDYELANIEAIKFGGDTYMLVDAPRSARDFARS